MNEECKGSILITGAARRIGAELARALARDGWYICVHHNTSGADAEALLAEMQKRMKDAVAGADLESMLKTWMPSGLQGLESMQKAFWAQTMGLNEDKD